MKFHLWLLLAILCLAAVLRFYHLDFADVYTDEALIAFRSIGYVDFFASPDQTTPWEWFSDSIPFWAKLSFHDHPPLVFLIQHLFFRIFGTSIFVLRLPFVLAGLGSVVMLFFISRELFKRNDGGVIACLLLAVSSNHVWVSRIGLQESIVIFLSLLVFYFFLRSLKDERHWRWGIALGLALLAKYTSLVLVLIFFCYLFLARRPVLKSKNFWLALVIAGLIFSPVIFYNLNLYQVKGHFDLQLSYLFGQVVPEWQSLPGKEQAGSFFERITNLFPNLYQGLLWPMFILFFAGLIFSFWRLLKDFFASSQRLINDFLERNQAIILLILAIFFHFLLFLLIGPSPRFLAMISPYVILLITYFLFYLRPSVVYPLVSLVILCEIFFAYNTLLVHSAWGREGLTYSRLKLESVDYGYNQLNDYLDEILKNKTPTFSFQTRYPFLEEIKKKALVQAGQAGKTKAAILLIYDANMYDLATFWLFHRRLIYEGWPIVTADEYLSQSDDFWESQGVEEFYFISVVDSELLLQPLELRTGQAEVLSQKFKPLQPEIIKRPDGREIFAVYKW